jgi:LPS O-antigen subunit length determinant protein (WzzB/FepE family)
MPAERTTQQVRQDIDAEREELAKAVEELRASLGEATDIAGKLKAKLPLVAGAAASTGFVLAGGVGATMRYFARRGREGHEKARVGRFSLFDRD